MADVEAATLARPYARAAFSQALQAGLPVWSRMLALLAAASQADKVRSRLANPLVAAADKVTLLAQVMTGDLTAEGKNLLALLAEHGRLALLPAIAAMFEQLRAQHDKSVTVNVVSAFEVSEPQARQLGLALQRRLQRKVTLETSQDKALIGGLLVKVEDTVMDGSVRGRLQKLAQALG